MRLRAWSLLCVVLVVAASCGRSGPVLPLAVEETVTVRGVVRDWRSDAQVGGATVSTIGILPALSAQAAADGTFVLEGVPIYGFLYLAAEGPNHVTTLSPALLVEATDVFGVVLPAVAKTDASSFETEFGVSPDASKGTLLTRAESPSGNGIPGVSEITLDPDSGAADGPFFLTAARNPDSGLSETSDSGDLVLFNVSTGGIAVLLTADGLAFEPQSALSIPETWSLVYAPGDGPAIGGSPTPTPTATPSATPTPPSQSWATNIYPIFATRGCNPGAGSSCHRTGQPAGGLRLDQGPAATYPLAVARVNVSEPDDSLLLVKPLFEIIPNHGGGNIFLTTADPDYQKIRRWISDGAPNN